MLNAHPVSISLSAITDIEPVPVPSDHRLSGVGDMLILPFASSVVEYKALLIPSVSPPPPPQEKSTAGNLKGKKDRRKTPV